MDLVLLRAQMPALVQSHIPSNVRRFTYCILDGVPRPSSLGITFDPKPFEGKVVAKTEQAIVVKTGRAEFAVLDRSLVTRDPEEGAKVLVEPYARRRFDGLRADTPEQRTERRADGTEFVSETMVLGAAPAKLPIAKPRCPELAALIEQLEELPAPDGFRRITHMLVDAGAKAFNWVDPKPSDICKTPPAITFTVSAAKFDGAVRILYDRGADAYVIEFLSAGQPIDRIEDVYFEDLGNVLASRLDDGSWRRIHVTPLPARTCSPA
ncbi:GTPase [Paracidovorax avenae]|nr:GTPase [Paracidovorax avenae]